MSASTPGVAPVPRADFAAGSVKRPAFHSGANVEVTRSPTLTWRAPGPTATTRPEASEHGTRPAGAFREYWPLTISRSR